MKIEFDEAKRAATLNGRGLDFADAGLVFAGRHGDRIDTRKDYGEVRVMTAGYLRDRFVLLIWTQRGEARRIISMRYGHAEEEAHWRDTLR